ncbi:MAG: hypothetical protein RI897_377 [Verrucomicrobiota bacterium]
MVMRVDLGAVRASCLGDADKGLVRFAMCGLVRRVRLSSAISSCGYVSRLVRWLGCCWGFAFLVAALQADVAYKVRKGDTLTGIASKHSISVEQLASRNGISSKAKLQIGQSLMIPDGAGSADNLHTIRRGDTLSQIASDHGVTVSSLARLNNLRVNSVLRIGQRLRIPAATPGKAPVSAVLPDDVEKAVRSARVRKGRWKHIVLHHSGTATGSVEGMDQYHRKVRHMENGLAYHFVIGNGKGMKDGEIAVGARWTRQLQGGHLASESLNQVAIGICLVGNFDKASPTPKQLKSLEALVEALRNRCSLPRSAVKTHQQINPVHTRCPGSIFAASSALKRLQD